MKQEGHPPYKLVQAALKNSPYEYKLRRYRARKVKKEEIHKETEDLERFTMYGSEKQPEEKDLLYNQNVAVRRHMRKKELEYKVRRNGVEAEKEEEHLPYTVELKKVKEKESNITYTLDMVSWESRIEEFPPQEEVENRLLLDQNYDVIKWEEAILYDDRVFNASQMNTHLVIDVNDRNLLFDIIEKEPQKEKKTKKRRHIGSRALSGKYNISGDKHYVEANETLRSTLGIQGVQHSIPALKLSPVLYKTYLTKEELRSFHKPQIFLTDLLDIKFLHLHENTSKSSAIIKKKRELTLTDTAEYLLLEYSEEIPPLILNPGMVSVITTFYRKSSSKEAPSVDPEIGTVSLLDPKDPSPFMFIGDVYPGEQMASIINNLYKAPIFFHKSQDLLCIRTKEEEPKYYIRAIDALAAVGQTLPLDEVFSPHSRRHNLFCKSKLKVAAYRLFYEKGNKERKVYIQQLDSMFPHFSEGSKRKWLKEYAEYVKKGKDNVWVLKPSSSLLTEDDLRRAVTPEQVCQYESMLAEERRLKDSGVVLSSAEEEGGEEEELKLAVWNLTRNFVNATLGKGMLEITGPGDPTGIGEGFSFVKAKRKERETEEEGEKKSTSEQMQSYKEEIKQIWDKQHAALSNSTPPERNEEEWYQDKQIEEKEENEEEPPESEEEKKSPLDQKQGKILSITRLVLKGDKKVQETEIVSDPRVIDAYLKARKIQKREEARTSLRCGSCGQIGHMKTNKTCMNYKGKAAEKKAKKKSSRALLCEVILSVIKELFTVPFSMAFHRPVSLKKFPNYMDFVRSPIDLTTIKGKAKNGEYQKYLDFLNDVKLMSTNCNTYNGPGHSLTKISNEMIEITERAHEDNKEAIAQLEDAQSYH
ncbi:transcription initiation factor TFIID subunit 1 [Nematocida sp. LUAm3]|nr:transcription initiation factor TFIID subunit 1 [Nematocida sp. LUAm3]KAI5176375.1 transcription initiation factor TFIID subunit 1 [Nematocida sp. LUAm2]KAI5179035.1 transcription initiation factor TFIID subunit 1 [Nematocida sp. LUAm1]